MRIVTLFLRHGTGKYATAEEELEAIFARQLPGVDRTTIVVDSALPEDYLEISSPRHTVIGSDNSFWEWSSADRAIAYLGEHIWSYDLVHVATAAFNVLYTAYLQSFSIPMLRLIVRQPLCLGHIDCYNEPIRFGSYHSQHWVRTSFLFLPPAEVKALRTLISFRNASSVFSGNPQQPFRADTPLSANYQEYIQSWLLGNDIGQGVTWHSGFELNSETLPLFEKKTMAILNEHLLSIRLRAQGCHIVDTTWLATQMKDHPDRPIQWDRNWRAQLAERFRDPLVIPLSRATVSA